MSALRGLLGALLIAAHLAGLVWRRVRVMRVKLPRIFVVDMSLQAAGALVLIVNGLPQFHNTGLYTIGITFVLAMVMYAFVRRIASLIAGDSERPARFDPHQG